jgi:hypothetical protein
MRAAEPTEVRPLLLVGKLVASTDSTMSVQNDASTMLSTVPLWRVERLEVSDGSNRGQSELAGAFLGAGIGGLLGYVGGEDCPNEEWVCFSRDGTAAFGALLGAAVGTVVGLPA